MGTFAIACPDCGNYVQVHNGLLGLINNTVTCKCGRNIDVRAERMQATVCPKCRNTVIYDRGKKRGKQKCAVCGTLLWDEATAAVKDIHMKAFHCPQCNIALEANEGTKEYTCPICDCRIDVEKEVASQKQKDSGLISDIKYDGDNETIVFKHPIEDFRNGSQLTVHASQQAVFFRDGEAFDILGAGRYALETQNLPLMDRVYKLPTDRDTPFHAQIYFVNITTQMGFAWGTTNYSLFRDPVYGFQVALKAYGRLNFRISNAKKLLLKLVGTTDGLKRDDILGGPGQSHIKDFFQDLVRSHASVYLAQVIQAQRLDILNIQTELIGIAGGLKALLSTEFDEYGIEITNIVINSITLPDQGDPGYESVQTLQKLGTQALEEAKIQYLKEIGVAEETAKKEKEAAEQKTAAQKKDWERSQKIKDAEIDITIKRMKDEQELDRLQREGNIEAEIMGKKGYTQRDVIQGDVLKTFAEHPGEGTGNLVRGAYGEAMQAGVGLGMVGTAAGMAQDVIQTGVNVGKHISDGITNQSVCWTCVCGANNSGEAAFCSKCGKPKDIGNSEWICECGAVNTGDFCTKCGNAKPIIWECTCGTSNIGNFCTKCGKSRPAMADSWLCPKCHKNVITNACPNCGTMKPSFTDAISTDAWDCPKCGKKGLTGKFCSECATARPIYKTIPIDVWDCPQCGKKGLTGKFCPECATAKPKSNSTSTWDCPQCGKTGLIGKFCPECALPRPE